MLVIWETKTFHRDFDIPENVDKNLKHETEFIIGCNESLTEYKTKTSWPIIVQI